MLGSTGRPTASIRATTSCALWTAFWRLWGCLRERDRHRQPRIAANVDLTPDLLNERPNKAIAERSFAKMRYPDPIIPDDQFKPSRLAAARLDQDHPCPWCGEALRLLQAGITVDALLTDIRLPEANGGEAATAYHERFPDPACPVYDRVCGANAVCSGRDHHLGARQDGSGDRRPGSMGSLREAPFLPAVHPCALASRVSRRSIYHCSRTS